MFRKLLLLSSFVLFLWAEAHIFVYHRFGDPRYPSTNTSLKELEREFRFLKKHGYEVIPLEKLVSALKNHEPINERWVVLTIDDGFKSFLNALPLFKKYNYPFTIFIATKPIEGKYPDFLSWSNLKKISKYGTIGLHSHAHPHLCNLSDKAIKSDTQKAIALFQKRLGFKPKFYAYPYGEHNNRVKRVIKSFEFDGICNQNRGAVAATSDRFDLDRIALVGRSNLKTALRIQHLDVKWIEPKGYPKNSILEKVIAKIDPHYKSAYIYVTDYGWKRVKVKNGFIKVNLGYKLQKGRIRVIIKAKDSKINTKILVRSRYGAK